MRELAVAALERMRVRVVRKQTIQSVMNAGRRAGEPGLQRLAGRVLSRGGTYGFLTTSVFPPRWSSGT